MKTIRQNTFETNSSSTHAVSFTSTLSRPPTIKPVVNGPLTLKPTDWADDETWYNKMSLLGLVWFCSDKAKTLITQDKLEKVLTDYVGETVKYDFDEFETRLSENMKRNPSRNKLTQIEDMVSYSYFTGGDGAGFDDSDHFFNTVCEILSSDDKIIRFCFTESIYTIEEWYNG